MTTRKPNLLYVADAATPWLQLAVVSIAPNSLQQHARQWQSTRAHAPRHYDAAVLSATRKH